MLVSGQAERALVAFDRYIAKDADNALAWMYRGQAALAKSDVDTAVENENRALQLNAKSPEALTIRGAAFAKKKDYALALADFDKAVALGGNTVRLYFARAITRQAQGKHNLALADLRAATQAKAQNVFEIIEQGQAKKLLQQVDKGISCGRDARCL